MNKKALSERDICTKFITPSIVAAGWCVDTGKTYTAFQIIYRLWKSGSKKRILFLADRTSLIDQTVRGDFRHFKEAMTVIKHKQIDTAYNIYLALYQGLSDTRTHATHLLQAVLKEAFAPATTNG